jgi:hypothetical protein
MKTKFFQCSIDKQTIITKRNILGTNGTERKKTMGYTTKWSLEEFEIQDESLFPMVQQQAIEEHVFSRCNRIRKYFKINTP